MGDRIGDNGALSLQIGTYRTWVTILSEEDGFEYAAFEALVSRSILQRQWDSLTEDERNTVRRLDDQLVMAHERVAEALDTFIPRRYSDSGHWWWHLDQGPQVREEAEQATREAR